MTITSITERSFMVKLTVTGEGHSWLTSSQRNTVMKHILRSRRLGDHWLKKVNEIAPASCISWVAHNDGKYVTVHIQAERGYEVYENNDEA